MKNSHIYRWDLTEAPVKQPVAEGDFFLILRPLDISKIFPAWIRSWGIKESIKAALKVLSGTRVAFGVMSHGKVVQSGWANIGFCRFYPVDSTDIVLGALYTEPPCRGRGIASAAITHTMERLYQHGYRRFYIDVEIKNIPSQRMIEKAGFRDRISKMDDA